MILESEGRKQSAILIADGEREATVLNAEGERQAAFKQAEGRERLAEAEAKATKDVSAAIAKGDIMAVNYFIAQEYTKALATIGAAPNNKVVMIPLEGLQPHRLRGRHRQHRQGSVCGRKQAQRQKRMNWQIWVALAMVLIIADVFALNSTVIMWFGIGAAFAAVAAAIGVGTPDTGWMWQLGVFAVAAPLSLGLWKWHEKKHPRTAHDNPNLNQKRRRIHRQHLHPGRADGKRYRQNQNR